MRQVYLELPSLGSRALRIFKGTMKICALGYGGAEANILKAVVGSIAGSWKCRKRSSEEKTMIL